MSFQDHTALRPTNGDPSTISKRQRVSQDSDLGLAAKQRKIRQCPYCHKKYSSSSNRKRHIQAVHASDYALQQIVVREAPGPSTVVVKNCPPITLVADHMKPYRNSCIICHKSFRAASHLQAHQVVHTGERPFACDMCGKTYTQKGHMYQHRRKDHSAFTFD